MRKALRYAAALIVLLSGTGVVLGGPSVQAAELVKIIDGPGDPTKAWKFEPAAITVPAGSTVSWTNTGDQVHTVTADDGSFDSGDLANGKGFSTPVTKSVTYECTPHPWMKGTITVSGAPTTAATSTPTSAAGSAPTTAAPASSTTTTTAKAAAGGSTTTTTAGGGVTSTTQAPAVTPTSAPETGGVTTTTAASSGGADEAAADGHGSEQPAGESSDKSSPIGIAFVSLSTLLLLGISGKLLASKS